MNTPRYLMGATLLFWGWQTGLWAGGILLALVLEGSGWVGSRLPLGPREWRRLWDLTALSLVGTAGFCYSIWPISEAVLKVLQWLPVVFLPFMVGQAYSREGEVRLDTFFWLWRGPAGMGPSSPEMEKALERSSRHVWSNLFSNLGFAHARRARALTPYPEATLVGNPGAARMRINTSFAYFSLCLFSASAASQRNGWYYPGLCALAGWALGAKRPLRVKARVFVGLFLIVVGAGYLAHQQWRYWQSLVETQSNPWTAFFGRSPSDDLSAYASLGRVGDLKLSGRVVMRVEGQGKGPVPGLLRLASFNQLSGSAWLSTRRQFIPVKEEEDHRWRLRPGRRGLERVTVSMEISGGQGLLPVPEGRVLIDHLPASEVAQSQYGAVQVVGGSQKARYEVEYKPGEPAPEQAPSRLDLALPRDEAEGVARVARELGLQAGFPAAEVMRMVANYFSSQFKYVPYRDASHFHSDPAMAPVTEFLTVDRAGHCEQFATATVLLMRQAGWPARYVLGFAVPPAPGAGQAVYVRERDAHAWAEVWLEDSWKDFDTTPANWREIESGRRAWFAWLPDGWSQFWFRMVHGQLPARLGRMVQWFIWPLALMTLWAVWRAWRRWHRSGSLAKDKPTSAAERLGVDSDFYRIVRILGQAGWERAPEETVKQWLARLRAQGVAAAGQERLRAIVELHYRHRFDPLGLSAGERQLLRGKVEEWMESRG